MKKILKKLPRSITYGCPDNCEKCGKEIWAVFRIWNSGKNIVEVEFCHKSPKLKDCKKKYLWPDLITN